MSWDLVNDINYIVYTRDPILRVPPKYEETWEYHDLDDRMKNSFQAEAHQIHRWYLFTTQIVPGYVYKNIEQVPSHAILRYRIEAPRIGLHMTGVLPVR